MLAAFLPVPKKLVTLAGSKEYALVVLKARQLFMRHELPSTQQRRVSIQTF